MQNILAKILDEHKWYLEHACELASVLKKA
uniref:Uncharacterized protein n=1 Tax=viral metagenome TaxID=1070528 RepID=A0A6C0J1M6_9ZZZZ